MSTSHSEKLERRHNEGQQDAANNRGYNAPHSELEKLMAPGDQEDKMIEENQAYRAGWRNVRDQK